MGEGIDANAILLNTSLLGIDGAVDALEAIYHKWETDDKISRKNEIINKSKRVSFSATPSLLRLYSGICIYFIMPARI